MLALLHAHGSDITPQTPAASLLHSCHFKLAQVCAACVHITNQCCVPWRGTTQSVSVEVTSSCRLAKGNFVCTVANGPAPELVKWTSMLCRYHQAGTPKLEVSTSYDSSAHTYTIRTKQTTPTPSGHSPKQPVMLPLAVALFDKNGHEMPLKLQVRAL